MNLPIYMLIFCPECKGQHIDHGEWRTRLHRRHLCAHCKHVWRAADVPSVGVDQGAIDELARHGQ